MLNDELSPGLVLESTLHSSMPLSPCCSIFIGTKIEQQGDELMLSQQGDELMLSQRRYTQVVLDRFDTPHAPVPVPSPSYYASPSPCPPLPCRLSPAWSGCMWPRSSR